MQYLSSTVLAICILSHAPIGSASKLQRRVNDDVLGQDYDEPGTWIPSAQLQDIRCDGPLPGFQLPITSAWNPNTATLQEVCSSHLVGRTLDSALPESSHPSMGGYCGQTVTNGRFDTIQTSPMYLNRLGRNLNTFLKDVPGTPSVIFGGNSVISNPRLYLFCRDRCYCNATVWARGLPDVSLVTGVRIRTQKPRGYPHRSKVFRFNRGLPSERITLDRHNTIKSDRYDVHTIAIKYFTSYYAAGESHVISLYTGNWVECSNVDLPSFPFPAPYNISPPNSEESRSRGFENVLKLCAVALSGGNPGANAGAYCHRGKDKNFVAFSDEMTPRVEWTFQANYRFSFLLRRFCVQQCWCASASDAEKVPGSTWQLDGVSVSENGDGKVVLESSGNNAYGSPVSTSVTIAPAEWGKSFSMPCTVDGVDYCAVEKWPTHILGELPDFYPVLPETEAEKASLELTPAANREVLSSKIANSAMCGQTCAGPAWKYCAGYAQQRDGCRCVVPSEGIARMLGYDPVAPPALCISTELVKAMGTGWLLRQVGSKPTRLNGRSVDIDEATAENVDGWYCPCNSTYVSQSCC